MDCSWLLLLLSLLGDLDISATYNVESLAYRSFSAEDSHQFGYKVAQMNSSSGERILIGDPGSNTLHSCDVISDKCDIITLPSQQNASHLGLTLEVEPVSSRCLVCGYEEPHDCSKNLYMNGACYTVDSSLVASQMESPGYQECEKVEVDLCFLFDDSYSVGVPEFTIVQEFLVSAVKNLKNSTMNFAVVQFASRPQKIFDFKDYQRGDGQRLLDAMRHVGGVTNTFQAINFTLNEIFTASAGEREKAKKIIVLVTDGEATDKNNNVTERADEQGVTRYVIAIGKNYRTELIDKMASSPAQNHSHMMQSYSNLKGFFTELQSKILAIEGVGRGRSRVSFTREMSSAGLSAAVTQERRILGDPGIFEWSGGILDVSKEEQLIYMSQKEEDKYAYLGYSITLLHSSSGLFCVVGSPRFQYVGLVTVLEESAGEHKWKKIGSVLGKQVGSYFGAEIAVSDLDQDGVTDLVLISAPHHYERRWSGEVSVCRFTEMLNCTVTLHGEPGHLHSQFGSAVSSLEDLDGDGYTEVAVGAPYEMDGRGALYIYKGRPAGLSAVYMQRLLSPPGILGFGLSVHGVLDMTEDGLVDVAVGSWGHVTLHRSQPLFNVSVSVTSNQTYMVVSSLEANGCDNGLTLEACVLTEIQTTRYTDSLSLSVHYHLVLDSHKPQSRMFFTNKQRAVNGTLEILGRDLQCKNYTIFLQDCGLEDVSEVQVSLTAFVERVESPWLLSQSSNLSAANLISFQMCEEGEKCEPDMSIELHHSPLVVQDGASFSIFLGLQNMHVKAHQTRLTIRVPAGLYFRKANFTEASQRISVVCSDVMEQMLMCNVSHPYLRRRVKAVIQIMFSIASNMSWADHILLAINVTSDGNVTSSSAEHEVPVLYPIHIISRVENSTKHVPFTKPDTKANATHRYKIQNLGLYAVPINLSVSVSSYEAWIEGVSWDFIISSSQNSHVRCFELNDSSAIQTNSEKTETVRNKTWQCVLEESGEISINITGRLKPKTTWKVHSLGSVRSAVMIQYNELRYHSDRKFHTAQVVTQVELLVTPDHMPYIVGGTMVGLILMIVISILLYKCGFFRRYKDRMMEDAASCDPQQQMEGKDTEAAAQLMGPQETKTLESL